MDRRGVLSTIALSISLMFAGCLDAFGGSHTATDTRTTISTATPDPVEDVMIRVDNETSQVETPHVVIRENGNSILDQKKSVDPHELVYFYPGIEQTGTYELAVTVDEDRAISYPFEIVEFDLDMGSNIIVIINSDSLDVLMQQ
jgi:hypothetical protein